MYKWLRTLREHFAMHDNLKDFQSKPDEGGENERPIVETNNVSDVKEASFPREKSDVIKCSEGEEKDSVNTEEFLTGGGDSVDILVSKGGEEAKDDQVDKSGDV